MSADDADTAARNAVARKRRSELITDPSGRRFWAIYDSSGRLLGYCRAAR